MDIIFDEDAGFLSAIKTFMATAKRPVVLTTNGEWCLVWELGFTGRRASFDEYFSIGIKIQAALMGKENN